MNNTVQTTRTRTMDGKFLTTISTVSTLMEPSTIDQGENRSENIFGQSTTLKRALSNQSFNNSLNSLTKKVLQIENDRQEQQQRKDN